MKRVKLVLYRFSGRFGFLRIKNRCPQCDLTYVLLQRLVTETFRGEPVDLEIKPWLDNWWKVIVRGGWHAPILTVNGRVFSQGKTPDMVKLIRKIGGLLGREHLAVQVEKFTRGTDQGSSDPALPVLYFSPACSHCLSVQSYLEANCIRFSVKDITQSAAARQEVKKLSGRSAIPVLKWEQGILVGFDQERLREIFAIPAEQDKWTPKTVEENQPGLDQQEIRQTAQKAQRVLEANWIGDRTIPSHSLYPHQWNWDSGFTARGYLYFKPERAYTELSTLFRGQWEDGFLPHIIFNGRQQDYFPGPEYWRAEISERLPQEVRTSGISQPPIHASMIVDAPQLDPQRQRALDFLEEIYPRLKRLHDFYFRRRDPDGENLICIVHPWESGLDNTPIWDEPLSRIVVSSSWARRMQDKFNELAESGRRPKRSYIGKYSQLVQNLYNNKYDWQVITRNHTFLIQDVMFNALLCKAERDLGKIAEMINRDSRLHIERSESIAQAINQKLWDEEAGIYYDYDLVAQKPIPRDTIFSYIPLYAGICDRRRGERLLDSLRTHCFCVSDRHCVGIPSYDMCQVDYEGEFYWRGPVWLNINWFLTRGLRDYDQEELADWIEKSLLELVRKNGFFEYYEPETGKGLGASDFSWTAALVLDIAARYINNV